MTLIFDPSRSSKVKDDGANRKPVGPTYKCSPLAVQPHICHRFRDISSQNFEVDLLTWVGITPGPKFTHLVYHPAKFHHTVSTHAGDIPYKESCVQTQTETYKHRNSKQYIAACGDNKINHINNGCCLHTHHAEITPVWL